MDHGLAKRGISELSITPSQLSNNYQSINSVLSISQQNHAIEKYFDRLKIYLQQNVSAKISLRRLGQLIIVDTFLQMHLAPSVSQSLSVVDLVGK